MAAKSASRFEFRALLAKTHANKGQTIFCQGDTANELFFVESGSVKLTVVSAQGKEAVVALLSDNEFFGESCLVGQSRRSSTATALSEVRLLRIEEVAATRLLREDAEFSKAFITHLLQRSIRIEADLVDQLFNSSEKRLARLLLLLANFGKEDEEPQLVIPNISQETLAQMIGTTRSRVSYFMNKFRDHGLIDYNGQIEVHRSLLNAVLNEQPHIEEALHRGRDKR